VFYREKYRLELHWKKLRYLNDETAVLEGACFRGPVLQDAVQLEAPDFIDLDLTPQMLSLLDSYYIVRLSWQGVRYEADGSILLTEAVISNTYLKTIHKLSDDDFILINTEKHEEKTHPYHLVYESQVMRADKVPHKYSK
jgi:hypothetical protein